MINRRYAIKTSFGALAGLAPWRANVQNSAPLPVFKNPASPAEAVDLLVAGNGRYVSDDLTSFAADRAILRAHSEESQEPYAAVLSCSDSRVPPEIVFDETLGHLFVVRVAGNIATPDTMASLEYAAAVLAIKTILVLGHTNCGAVKAAAAMKPVPGQISSLFPFIHPATRTAISLEQATEDNAQLQASVVRDTSPVLRERLRQGSLSVVAAVYMVASGRVKLLDH